MQNAAASNARTLQLSNQAQAQGNLAFNQDTAQRAQNQAQFNQAGQTASNYNANLENAGLNAPQNYLNNFNQMGNAIGYNPQVTRTAENQLLPSERNMATLQNIYSSLPQAVNQMSNYSGATAGQVAQNYANLSSGLSGQVANASNLTNALTKALGVQQGFLGSMNTGANNMQQNQITGLTNASTAQNATMGQYGNVLNNVINAQGAQPGVTAQAVSNYANMRNNLLNARAARVAANAKAATVASTNAANNAAAAQANQALITSFIGSHPTTGARNLANALNIPLSEAGAYLTAMRNRGLSVNAAQPGGLSLGNITGGGQLQGAYGGLQ